MTGNSAARVMSSCVSVRAGYTSMIRLLVMTDMARSITLESARTIWKVSRPACAPGALPFAAAFGTSARGNTSCVPPLMVCCWNSFRQIQIDWVAAPVGILLTGLTTSTLMTLFETPSDARIPPVFFLGALAAISPLSLSIAVQSIPDISRSFSASYGTTQLIVSAFLLSFAISQLVVGPLSDRIGRKPVLYGGLLLYALASIGAAFANSIDMLVWARVFQGAGGCAALVTPRAIVQDTQKGVEAARMMAFVAMLQSVAPAVGPVIGGGLDAILGWRWIFGFLALFAGLLAVGSGLWLGETRPLTGETPDSWATIFMRYARLLKSRLYIGYTLTFTFGTTGFFGFLAVGPALLIQARGMPTFLFSLSLMLIALQFVIGAYISSQLVRRIGVDRTLWIGAVNITGAAILMFALAGSTQTSAVIVPLVIFAFFNGFIFPNAMAGATGIDPRIAGSAASFLGFAQLGTGAIIAFVLGNTVANSVIPLALCLLLLGLMSLFGMLLVRRSRH